MRTIVFVDGQNLYHLAKTAWFATTVAAPNPYDWPSYDVGNRPPLWYPGIRDASFPKSAFTPVSLTGLTGPSGTYGTISGLTSSVPWKVTAYMFIGVGSALAGRKRALM